MHSKKSSTSHHAKIDNIIISYFKYIFFAKVKLAKYYTEEY